LLWCNSYNLIRRYLEPIRVWVGIYYSENIKKVKEVAA